MIVVVMYNLCNYNYDLFNVHCALIGWF